MQQQQQLPGPPLGAAAAAATGTGAGAGMFRSIVPVCVSAVSAAATPSSIGVKLTIAAVVVVSLVLVWRWWRSRQQAQQRAAVMRPGGSLQDRVQRLEYLFQNYVAPLISTVDGGALIADPQRGGGHSSLSSHSDMLRKVHVDPADKDRVTMPSSGRFYDASEFHAVGFITQVRLHPGQHDPSMPDGVPSSLPLYGQRVTGEGSRVARWQYSSVFNNTQYNVVRVRSVQPFVIDDCGSGGCDEFDAASSPGGILVVVPNLAGGTMWKVKMYSRI